MPKVKLADAKAFVAASSAIRENNIMPVLVYMYAEFSESGVKLMRNNLKAFIVGEYQTELPETDKMLIPYKAFANLVNAATGDIIIMRKSDTRIYIGDGSLEIFVPTEDSKLFPVPASEQKTFSVFGKEDCAKIASALDFIQDLPMPQVASHVLIARGCIFASNAYIAYRANVVNWPDEIALTFAAANGIKNLEGFSYAESDSYMFFESRPLKLGFAKSEFKFIDVAARIGLPDPNEETFTVPRADLEVFVGQCLANVQDKTTALEFIFNGKDLTLKFEDASIGYKVTRNLQLDSATERANIRFEPENLRLVVRNVPGANAKFIRAMSGRGYFIEGDDATITTLIMTQL